MDHFPENEVSKEHTKVLTCKLANSYSTVSLCLQANITN